EKKRKALLEEIEDNMLVTAAAISRHMARKRSEDEGDEFYTSPDTLAMFKQVREYQLADARIKKIDPNKGNDDETTPSGIRGYQEKLAEDKAAAEPKSERVTAAGDRDRRHDNSGRPPGQGLKNRMTAVRAQQTRLANKDAKENPPEDPPAQEPSG